VTLGRSGRQPKGAPGVTPRPGLGGKPVRRSGGARPATRRLLRLPRSVGRPSLSPTRAAAILGLLAASGAVYGLAATPAFTLTRTELPELKWTTREALIASIATPSGMNLFRIRTAPIEARLETLPGVASADVFVSLPDTLVVRIRERTAILAWAVGERRYLVDRDGVLFAASTADAVTAAGLPTIGDSRTPASALKVGSKLDPVDLDAATRLGSLTPADVGSRATTLVVQVTTANGFVLGTLPRSWIAVFGLYTPSLRTPAIVPGQVRLLRSLLSGREASVERVFLPDEDSGTVILKPTPAPMPTP
jgi:cell division septal protein FtsQ